MSETESSRTLPVAADRLLALAGDPGSLARWLPGVPDCVAPVDAGPDQVRLTAGTDVPEPGTGLLVRSRAAQRRVEWSRPGTAATGWLQVEVAGEDRSEAVVHLSDPDEARVPGTAPSDAERVLDALAALVG